MSYLLMFCEINFKCLIEIYSKWFNTLRAGMKRSIWEDIMSVSPFEMFSLAQIALNTVCPGNAH